MPKIPLPGENPSTEAVDVPFTIEDYGGLDTKAKRPAIDPKNFYWLENWMPIGPGNLRTLYDNAASAIYTASNPRTIIYYTFYNIGSTRYCAVFLDNGTAVQVNTATLATTTISATSGKFWSSGSLPHAVQYQAKYLMITSKVSDNAYWAWDGASLFGPGTLAPQVLVTNSGIGTGYASAPTITAYGGTGSGATFTATLDSQGHVTDVKVTAPGSGYDHEDLVTLVFTGGGVSQDQARFTATVSTSSCGVALVTVTNGGAKYSAPVVAFSGGGGSGAVAFVSGAANGSITDITVTNPGTGYTSAPTVGITDATGTGAVAVCEIRGGQITGITVNSGGGGYVGQPDVLISEPNNLDFPAIQAEAYATVVAGAVTAVTVTNPGLGYKSASAQAYGGNGSAFAEVSLMPFGISGTCLETYQSRVWVGDDTKLAYTGADSVRDFAASKGGGVKPLTDSNLREKLVALKQANGFLYTIGDSSVAVISNVQTSTSGVTTFNFSNVDAQIGTAWRDSVQANGRALVFANPTGVYALYGGAAEKVSQPLDGLFAAASFNTGGTGVTPTSGTVTLFGIRCYAFEMTTTNLYTGATQDLILLWDGQHWFAASQSEDVEILAGQEISSELSTYGATDTAIFKLFDNASSDLTKVFQTKLAGSPTYFVQDQVMRVYYIAQLEGGDLGTLDIALENQGGPGQTIQRPVSALLNFFGSGPIQFTGLAGADLNFSSRGLVIDGYDDSMIGNLIGATVSTEVADLTLISMTILLRPYAPDG